MQTKGARRDVQEQVEVRGESVVSGDEGQMKNPAHGAMQCQQFAKAQHLRFLDFRIKKNQ